ncbi:MAG: AraC family transcriptional regulator, partial [Myxococcota bacterium]
MDELTFGWRSALLLVFFGHFIVAGALLQRRTAERDAHRILAVLLLVVAGILTPQIIGFAGFYDAFPWLTFAPFAVPLALGPA